MPLFDCIELNGEWSVTETEKEDPFLATVPGCIHTDLLSSGRIPDPFHGLNELDVLWVADASWTYSRTFAITDAQKAHIRILLLCKGLDTLATITVNDTHVGETDNMFRSYKFEVANLLRIGENVISITFQSPSKHADEKLQKRWLANWGVPEGDKLPGVNYLRKAQYHFGWDWGPKLGTCGIWKGIEIQTYSHAVIHDIHVCQAHNSDLSTVSISTSVNVSVVEEQNYKCVVGLWRKGVLVCSNEIGVTTDCAGSENQIENEGEASLRKVEVEFILKKPDLWWPNGLGDPNLYKVAVELTTGAEELLDAKEKTIGLRTLKFVRKPDQWGESFHFEVNNVPFFSKGGNWIPADAFLNRVSSAKYYALLKDCAEVNMNMIRVWGGGIYEDDSFYDACDRLGLCVWQDFMFSCAAYPVFDSEWLANVLEEAKENVGRLRHHACIALWCGNNELEQGLVGDEYTRDTMSWSDYSLLFDRMLRDVVLELNPESAYWPGSPHSPLGNRTDFNNPKWGDAHLWGVWHGKEPFEWYRKCEHRFNSEFGFQSFPNIHTVRTYVPERDQNLNSRVMEHHQRSGIGNQTIVHYVLDWFRTPTKFEKWLWVSQITQGMAMKYAVEHWRRSMPRGMGTLYWQLNDCWPVASWSSIDYYGRWKALHYMARAFFGQVLISGVENKETLTVQLFVTNDNRTAINGRVCWELWTMNGAESVASGSEVITAQPLGNTVCASVELLSVKQGQHSEFNVVLMYWFEQNGITLSTNASFFVRPKHLNLENPQLSWSLNKLEAGWVVEISAEKCAFWVFIDDKHGIIRAARCFFHITPGCGPIKVPLMFLEHGKSTSNMKEEDIRDIIRIYSLYDLAL